MSGARPRVGTPGISTGNMIRDSSFGLVPETLDPIVQLNDSVWRCNSVRPAFLEMLRLRNARTVNCVFCRNVRYDVARKDGLSEEKVARIEDGFDASELSAVEKLVLAFADVYLRSPGHIEAQLISRLQAHFSAEQICHMAISIATFNATSKCAVSLGGMPESMPVTEIPLPPL